MTTTTVKTMRRLFLAAVLSVAAETAATSIPESKITALESALTDKPKSTSPARRRLTLKRMIRAGQALLKTHTTASNRYAVLGILFRGRQELHGLDKSTANREALLEVCRQLVDAPDAYADIRLDAELLLSQVELARKGASPSKRAEALRALMGRYRDTPAETKLFRIATLMALEIGDDGLLAELRRFISERASNDLEMIEFLRDHLGGQIFGAPFCGTFTSAGGTTFSFPIDRIGWSTVFLFWSKENEQLEERLAKWQELKDQLPSMFRIFSFNVDELPDAGESILRKMKADWPAMRLPGGRTSLTYRAYARTDPVGVHVSPSGYAAMIMPGLHRDDYPRRVQSYLKKDTRYLSQLRSLFIGEFLVVDPLKPFDPGTPPECKTYTTATSGTTVELNRTADGVPVKTLAAIQACFVTPPFRYRLSHEEELGNYKKAEALCSRTIQQHPDAPNLWIVHNRRIIALLGLWKIACDPKHLEGAVREANACLALKPPPGADIVPRFCLAKEALRHKGASPKAIIGKFIKAAGGKQAPGSALAAASILALDAGARALHEQIRRTILDHHTENPMMWTVVSFLLNRYHRYYLYSAPYYRGWSFGRRRQAYFSNGQPEDANRVLRAGLKTLEGETSRMPRDTVGKWTVILFTVPWEDGGAFPDKRFLSDVTGFAQARDPQDINLVVAFLSDDKERAAALMKDNASDCRTMVVPGGMRNQMVQRLGILAEDKSLNVTVLRPDGTIALALSGLAKGSYKGGGLIRNIIAWDEEKEVDLALEDGDLEKARRLAFKRAPIEEPTSHDPKARKKRRPLINLHHLRSRAKVYMAMKDWKAALADIEQVVDRKTREDARMSMKTAELREVIRLRSVIRKELGQPEEDK